MTFRFSQRTHGYTIVELMITIVIVSVLAATVGVFVVKLMTFQEYEREQAYIREKLVDVCGIYADYLSVGSSISNCYDAGFVATYRHETGGVSLETNRLSRVVRLISSGKGNRSDNKAKTMDLDVDYVNMGGAAKKFSREFHGDDAPLIPMKDLKAINGTVDLSCEVTPLNATDERTALWNLRVWADYSAPNGTGLTRIVVDRMVRLWNYE